VGNEQLYGLIVRAYADAGSRTPPRFCVGHVLLVSAAAGVKLDDFPTPDPL